LFIYGGKSGHRSGAFYNYVAGCTAKACLSRVQWLTLVIPATQEDLGSKPARTNSL
jgi:hypothetical protein